MSIFTKILNKKFRRPSFFEDEKCFAIRDINPQAPFTCS